MSKDIRQLLREKKQKDSIKVGNVFQDLTRHSFSYEATYCVLRVGEDEVQAICIDMEPHYIKDEIYGNYRMYWSTSRSSISEIGKKINTLEMKKVANTLEEYFFNKFKKSTAQRTGHGF